MSRLFVRALSLHSITRALGALMAFGLLQPAAAQVLINEVDADQIGTDNAEFVELYDGGSGNTDLTGLVLVLYNGSSDTSYNAFDLDGQFTGADGYFVLCGNAATTPNCDLDVAPDTNLIQNGADAVALYTGDSANFPNGTAVTTSGLLDAIAYDTNDGDDIGLAPLMNPGQPQVNEGGDGNKDIHSNQRCPNGTGGGRNTNTYQQFEPTPGADNTCGGVAPPVEAMVVINEIDYDQPGSDAAEFVELKNVGTVAADLSNFSLQLVNGTGGGAAVYNTIALAGTLAPGEYYVVCANAANTPNCDLDSSPNTNFVQNGAPDAVGLLLNGVVTDAVSYEGNAAAPYFEGSGAGLVDSSTPFASISRFPDGIDTDQNNVDLSQRCITPGGPNAAAAADCTDPSDVPDILINELDADQSGTDSAEFIELYDGGAGNTSLDGLVLVLFNGNGDTSYNAFDLDGQTTNAMGYFVLCGNAANTANCDLDVSPDTNLLQNGADAAALYVGDAASFIGTPVTTVGLVDAIVYDTSDADDSGLLALLNAGQPQVDERGNNDGTGHSNQRCPDGSGGARNTDTYAQFAPSPGEANVCGVAPVVEARIHEIQGAGLLSPFDGQPVVTRNNVVTAVGPLGFGIQTPDAMVDADPLTSEGIYVFTGGAPTVAVGDLVDVTGTVDEFFDLTEITNVTNITPVGTGAVPAPVMFNLAVPSPDPAAPSCGAVEFECYEGMLVSLANGTVTGPNQSFGSDPVAEFYMTAGPERTFRGPGLEYPGQPGIPVWDGNPEVFEVDPDKLGLPDVLLAPESTFTVTGILGYEFGEYEIWASELAATPAPFGGDVRDAANDEGTVGSLNLFRLFDDVDDPPGMDAMGGETGETVLEPDVYQRRLDKLALYIVTRMKSPDVLGVQEVESQKVLEDLAAKIEALAPGTGYDAYLVEGNDIGGIDVGYMIRRDRFSVISVEQLGATEIYFDPEAGADDLLHDRPPLHLVGRFLPTGTPLNALVVHNRSLGGIESERVQLKRLGQAESIAAMADDIQGARRLRNMVIIGDFNAFEFSDGYVDVTGHMRGDFDPADALRSGADLVDPNLMNQVMSLPPEERYSFIFRGNSQALDHALTSQPLDLLVRGLEFARGNADAPGDLINDETTPNRSSDHDGFVLFIDVSAPKRRRR